jgi:2-polyprenyl-3-methyl-5-hydroxy-6-metoxy-1,4-benzoquinol methylase
MSQEYYEEYWSRSEPPPLGDPLAPGRLELLRTLLSSVRAERILEAGSGAGDLVAALAGDGYDAMGLEVSEQAVELAASRHPEQRFVRHSVEELPWPVEPGSFDAVVSFEVIEHLLRPRRLLEGAREALSPGGHFALSTPYHGLLKNLVLVLSRFDRHFDVEGDHVRFFSDRALRDLLADTGFEVVRIHHLGRAAGLWSNSLVWARSLESRR